MKHSTGSAYELTLFVIDGYGCLIKATLQVNPKLAPAGLCV